MNSMTLQIMFAILLGAAFLLLIEFAIINMILGCQTWDKSLWTETNSCVTFYQIIGLS